MDTEIFMPLFVDVVSCTRLMNTSRISAIIVTQNHGVAEVGKDIWKLVCPAPLLKQVQLETFVHISSFLFCFKILRLFKPQDV